MPLTKFVPHEPFESYRDRFAEHFIMTRSDDGVLEVCMHTGGGESLWGYEKHRALGQVLQTIGMDRDNQLLILTGASENWLMSGETASYQAVEHDPEVYRRESYEKWFHDATQLPAQILNLDIPTIGVVNGPGYHTETLLMCDLTLCSEHAVFFDPHLEAGAVPGDSQFLAFQVLMGIKRANYAALTGQRITSAMALEWGLVNEVHSTADLMPRARELAAVIMDSHIVTRRVTTQLMRRPWLRAVQDDFGVHLGHQLYAASVTPMSDRQSRQVWPYDPVHGRDPKSHRDLETSGE